MKMRESGVFSGNLGELERKTVKRKRVFVTLRVLGRVLEQLTEDIPEELKHQMELDAAMTEDLIAYNIIPLDAPSITNVISSLAEVKAAISGLKYFRGLPKLPEDFPIPATREPDMLDFLHYVFGFQVPLELHDAFLAAIDKGNIKSMPNRSMSAAPHPTPGAFLMGDAVNMRHPLIGGGMTVALSDIVVVRDLLRPLNNLNDASALCKYLESFYTLCKPVSSTINTLAGALYRVFCASPDPARKEMREACFDYLSLGGVFSNGPLALLSGLNPHPLSLILHFFAVAIYAVGRLLLPFPSPKRIWIGARLILVCISPFSLSFWGVFRHSTNKTLYNSLLYFHFNTCI